ncbi:MAG: hypothetical protein HC899_08380 [Leptolyngbyaceae cyanobacterium SM1_4_3]|nr:hypothetical protein [Leptolyngbyaceae cyanobacterium SM1_4_3]NJN89287.1 hypothetical protein [Leptolyngbyaceae cyanobacterium SL_5_14]
MANVFRVQDSEILARHQANINASLAHRLEVARASRNECLVALLEREQQQLGVEQNRGNGLSALVQWLSQRWHEWMEAIAPIPSFQLSELAQTGKSSGTPMTRKRVKRSMPSQSLRCWTGLRRMV